MAEYSVTNQSLVTITGTAGEDRLTYIYNAPTNDVWLLGIGPAPEGEATPVSGGYSGFFNGMGSNDCPFSGIEHFTFIDESGGNDWIVSGDGNDELYGGAGNDRLFGNGGIDVVDGGTGTDAWQADMHWATQAIRINLNVASSFLGSGSAVNVEGMDVKTGSGRDVITGHSSSGMSDTIATNGGNDVIKLWMGGTDCVDGGAGDDLLTVIYKIESNDVWTVSFDGSLATGYSGTFNGLGGNDLTFSGIERFSFTDLTGGNDIIITGDGDDTLVGGPGDDVLVGNGGIDRIVGGLGNDRWGGDLSTASTAITIDLNGTSAFLGSGSVAGIEAMDLKTGSGNDVVTGHRTSAMADTVSTGGGADRIKLWMGGTDSVDGGAGSDLLTVVYNIATNDVTTDSFSGSVAKGYSGTFNGMGGNDLAFAGIERFSFTDLSGGNDVLVTGGGNDTLRGGAGNDVLRGGGGRDLIDGGEGNDLWGGNTSFSSEAVEINLNRESSYLGTGVVRGIEALDLTTGAGADVITGHATAVMNDVIRTGAGNDRIRIDVAGSDRVDGGAGSDVLIVVYDELTNDVWLTNTSPSPNGGFSGLFNGMGSNDLQFDSIERLSFTDRSGGNDIIATGAGADTLNGGAGNDTLSGGGGSDRIDGGVGDDRLTGGGGADLFVCSGGMDVITDFAAGAGAGDQLRTAGWEAVDSWVEVQAALVSDDAGGSILVIEDNVNEVHFLDVGVGAFSMDDFLFV